MRSLFRPIQTGRRGKSVSLCITLILAVTEAASAQASQFVRMVRTFVLCVSMVNMLWERRVCAVVLARACIPSFKSWLHH